MVRVGTRPVAPSEVARELLRHVVNRNPDLHADVVVVTVETPMDLYPVREYTRRSGRRIMHLRYDWLDIEPYAYMPIDRLSIEVLAPMAEPGGVLRAQIRHARSKGREQVAQ